MTNTDDELVSAEGDRAEVVEGEVVVGSDPKLVPVSEAIRYRKRAQAAEQEVGELQRQLDAVGSNLRETSKRMAAVERARAIDSQLVDAGVADLDSARLLVGVAIDEQVRAVAAAVGEAGDEGEVAEVEVVKAVAAVRKRKPHLFRVVSLEPSSPESGLKGGVMGGAVRVRDRQAGKPVTMAAARALASGRRQDVLRYMRLRRAGG